MEMRNRPVKFKLALLKHVYPHGNEESEAQTVTCYMHLEARAPLVDWGGRKGPHKRCGFELTSVYGRLES